MTPLTRATGAEVGVVAHPLEKWEMSFDVFKLKLKSELVFDGDALIFVSSRTALTATENTVLEAYREVRDSLGERIRRRFGKPPTFGG